MIVQSSAIAALEATIHPYKQQIINHPVYEAIHTIDDLRIFMEHHIFAVWDFMSLLKSLQQQLTCTRVPWFPTGDPDIRYLINEIVTGEESDIDPNGHRKSHYELYLEAMLQCGADLSAIQDFLHFLLQGKSIQESLVAVNTAYAIKDFVAGTFQVITEEPIHSQAAVFTFSREDLIPSMFITMVNDLAKQFPDNISLFNYYLERHIEVDGDHHRHLALQMTAKLCGDDLAYWKTAENAIIKALKLRI
ncbi:DUF3050 domain-containing protein [Olivibacter ginsenosidimutans]